MNIHLPPILMFTRVTWCWPIPTWLSQYYATSWCNNRSLDAIGCWGFGRSRAFDPGRFLFWMAPQRKGEPGRDGGRIHGLDSWEVKAASLAACVGKYHISTHFHAPMNMYVYIIIYIHHMYIWYLYIYIYISIYNIIISIYTRRFLVTLFVFSAKWPLERGQIRKT